jgi:uncharacterized membrane protein
MASNPAMLYTTGKSVTSYLDWYQNYENRLAVSKALFLDILPKYGTYFFSNFKFEQKTSNQRVSDQL